MTYALLAAGENAQSQPIKRAVDYLMKLETKGTYVVGLRSQVWLLLPESKERRSAIERDAKLLTAGIIQENGERAGTYTYEFDTPGSDHSNTQIGVLGAWRWSRRAARSPRVTGSSWTIIGGAFNMRTAAGATTR